MAYIDKTSYRTNNTVSFSSFTSIIPPDYEHTVRVQRYLEYWKFYKGFHWSYSREQLTGEPQTTINYSGAIADAHVNFFMKNGFDIVLPDIPGVENDTVDRNFIKVLLDETWKRNQKPVWCFEAGQMGSVTGDVFLYFSWEENDPLYPPYVRVDVIPSHYCFPRLGGPHGRDRKKVEEFTILFPIYKEKKSGRTSTTQNSLTDIIMRAEVWTAESRKIYEGKELISEDPNPFGEIPIVHIPNFPVAGEYYGLSDLVNVIDLQRQLNEKCTDVSDIINYHSVPLSIIIGAQANQLQRGANRVWFLPAEAKYETMEMKGDLKANLDYIKLLRQFIFELSSTPEQALGHSDGSSVQQAAAAMSLEYLPMMNKREVKVDLYGNGLKLANRMILKIQEIMDDNFHTKFNSLKLESAARYLTDIVFPEPFPRNQDLELDRIAKKKQLGLTTRIRALQELGHGEEDAKTIVDEAMKEQMEDMKNQMMIELSGKQNSGNPNPSRPNPDVQGEKVSLKIEQDNKQ
jgi:hypothetical protein